MDQDKPIGAGVFRTAICFVSYQVAPLAHEYNLPNYSTNRKHRWCREHFNFNK